MSCKNVLVSLCAGLLLIVSAGAAERKPNVVVFLVDDMGWIDCGVNGSKYYRTPNIDRFALRALRFTDAYAQPLCSPTRASILSGKYSSRHGITSATGHRPPQPAGHAYLPAAAPANKPMLMPESKNFLEPSEYTLAEALHDAGYRTAHIGKWHLGLTPPHWPERQGFDEAFHCHPDPGPPGEYFSPYGVVAEGGAKSSMQTRVGTITDGPPGEYIVDRQAQEAERFITANKDRPFFLNLWCYGVHGPWGHKPEYTDEFAKTTDPRGEQGNPIMASMLRSVDECFGRIVDTLDRLGLAENTIVLFYSDNGGNTHSNTPTDRKFVKVVPQNEKFVNDWRKWAGDRPPTNNAPLRDGKGTLYEGGTRVPMMWAWAGKIKPGVTDTVAAHIDIYPTLVDLVGIGRPQQQQLDGVSLAKLLTDGAKVERTLFNYFPQGKSVGQAGGVWVRRGDWKLFRWFGVPAGDPARYELYNLRDDVSETNNLATAEPQRFAALDAEIDEFLKATEAAYPRPNPAYQPSAATARKQSRAEVEGRVQGWVPKGCTATIVDDHLHIVGSGRRPFLGTVQVKYAGPAVIRLRIRAPAGGKGQIQWRTDDQETFPEEGQLVDFPLAPGDEWQQVEVALPVQGKLTQLRLFVPAEKSPVDVAAIQYLGKGSSQPVAAWKFAAPR